MLTTQDHTALVRAHYDAFNVREWDKTLAMVSDNVKWTNVPFEMTYDGRKGFRQYLENWTTALPDCRVEVVNLIAGEGWIAAECVGRGTHTGPLVGPNGTIDPTYKKLDLRFCDVHRVVDGQITEGRSYFDGMSLMRQLGVLPAIQSPSAVPTRN